MKQFFLFLLVLVSFTACKKDPDPQPQSLADRFAGNYTLNSFRYNDGATELELPTLPLIQSGKTLASGTVKLTKATDTTLNLAFMLKVDGADDVTFNLDNLTARQEGSEYGLFSEGVRIADVDGTMVIFNYSETDPTTHQQQVLAFVAKK
jgi:hypothetical protein